MGGVLRFAWNKTLDADILWNSVVWRNSIFREKQIEFFATSDVLYGTCGIWQRYGTYNMYMSYIVQVYSLCLMFTRASIDLHVLYFFRQSVCILKEVKVDEIDPTRYPL